MAAGAGAQEPFLLSPKNLHAQARFFKDYEEHINKIMGMPSGEHSIDPERANQWIEAFKAGWQPVARSVIRNTRYIPFHEFLDALHSVYNQTQVQIQDDDIVVWLCGDRDKSLYLNTLIAYHFAVTEGGRKPDYIAANIYEEWMLASPHIVLVYFDDMAYSANQFLFIIRQIWESQKNVAPEIHLREFIFASCFISDYAFEVLRVTRGRVPPYLRTICKERIHSIYSLVKDDLTKSGELAGVPLVEGGYKIDGFKLNFYTFFGEGMCSVYFDFKVAEWPSTLYFILNFGYVSPYISESEGGELIPFIRGCEDLASRVGEDGIHPIDLAKLLDDLEDGISEKDYEIGEKYNNYGRCPKSWYKDIFPPDSNGGSGSRRLRGGMRRTRHARGGLKARGLKGAGT